MKKMPYQARTTSGDVYDLEFPLHPATQDAVRVSQLTSAVLAVLDREIKITGDISDGDLLQAVAMALAIRARMTDAPYDQIEGLTQDLLETALDAASVAKRFREHVGHA